MVIVLFAPLSLFEAAPLARKDLAYPISVLSLLLYSSYKYRTMRIKSGNMFINKNIRKLTQTALISLSVYADELEKIGK